MNQDDVEINTPGVISASLNVGYQDLLGMPATPHLLPSEEQKLHDDLVTGANILETGRIVERLRAASDEVRKRFSLDDRWVPVLASSKAYGSGEWEILFRNSADPLQEETLRSANPIFARFKEFVDLQLGIVQKGYVFEAGRFQSISSAPQAALDNATHAIFIIDNITELYKLPRGTSTVPGKKSTGSTIAEFHSWAEYLNQAIVGHLASYVAEHDAFASARAAITGTQVASELRGLAVTGEGMGVVLAGAACILDLIQLSQAKDDIERGVIGTKLVVDTISLEIGATALGAGLIGAETAAAVLGGAGVVFGGIAIGITALAEAYGEIARKASAVGAYFADVDNAYLAGGYTYNKHSGLLTPLVGAVIKKIDFKSQKVEFDSQMIYRTTHGKSGSGKINYFFWTGDYPNLNPSRGEAINVREGIGRKALLPLPELATAAVLVLPCTPVSYIKYSWGDLPGATTRHDPGFDVIRRLEQDYRFDFDFYIFPLEQIVDSIIHAYETTNVTVILNDKPVRLQFPTLPPTDKLPQGSALPYMLRSCLEYTVEGADAAYTIGPSYGGIITLKSASGHRPQWMFDLRGDVNQKVEKVGNNLEIAGMTVTLDDRNFSYLRIINNKNEVSELDHKSLAARIIREDASQWPTNLIFLEHLKQLGAQESTARAEFITVDGYTVGRGTKKIDVGRAYFDSGRSRMMYSVPDPGRPAFNDQHLGPVIGDSVYFYTPYQVWRVNVKDGRCIASYNGYFEPDVSAPVRVWAQGPHILVEYQQIVEGKTRQLIYDITGNSMTLISIIGEPALLDRLERLSELDKFEDLIVNQGDTLTHARERFTYRHPSVPAQMHPHRINVMGASSNGKHQRFWICKRRGAIQVIGPNLERGVLVPEDLVFAGSFKSDNDADVFYFYTHDRPHGKQRGLPTGKSVNGPTIYRRQRNGTGSDYAVPLTIPKHFGNLVNLVKLSGNLFADTDLDYFLHLTTEGSFFLEGVNFTWFAKHPTLWWKDINTVANMEGKTCLRVIGVKTDVKDPILVPIWYLNSRIVITAAQHHGKQIQLIGLNGDGSEAWLYHLTDAKAKTGHLYRQKILQPAQLDGLISLDGKLTAPDRIPAAIRILPDIGDITSARRTKNGMDITTNLGYIFVYDETEMPTLVGVDTTHLPHPITDSQLRILSENKTWHHRETITLQGTMPATPSWYHVANGRRITAGGLTWADRPAWVGMTADGTMGYVHLQSSCELRRVQNSNAEHMGSVTICKRFNKSLVLAYHPVHPEDEIIIPTLADTECVILSSGTRGGNTYRIRKDIWKHYKRIVIDSCNETDNPDKVVLEINAMDLLAQKNNADLILYDSTHDKSVTILKAFGTNKDDGKFTVHFSDVSLTVQDFEVAERWASGHVGDSPVTLGVVSHLKGDTVNRLVTVATIY